MRFLLGVVAAIALLGAGPALATPSNSRGGNGQGGNGQGGNGQGGGGYARGAPEPLTLIGLGLGAGAVGFAKWRSSRKTKG